LTDGHRFLYTVAGGRPETSGVHVSDVAGMPPVRLMPDQVNAAFVPSSVTGRTGHLLFKREATLMAQPFDADSLRITGEMFPLADNVGAFGLSSFTGAFSASSNGVLAYSAGTLQSPRQLVWVDQTGKLIESAGPPGSYFNFQLAPDEKKIVF